MRKETIVVLISEWADAHEDAAAQLRECASQLEGNGPHIPALLPLKVRLEKKIEAAWLAVADVMAECWIAERDDE
jgi:hypothetical protein